ncbi:hypothetical protein HYV49_05115 [Candidatus Pacearchaeota archaeon]|nr:hypothetical protein [Candidatus Pacearchaeota archaeon]
MTTYCDNRFSSVDTLSVVLDILCWSILVKKLQERINSLTGEEKLEADRLRLCMTESCKELNKTMVAMAEIKR